MVGFFTRNIPSGRFFLLAPEDGGVSLFGLVGAHPSILLVGWPGLKNHPYHGSHFRVFSGEYTFTPRGGEGERVHSIETSDTSGCVFPFHSGALGEGKAVLHRRRIGLLVLLFPSGLISHHSRLVAHRLKFCVHLTRSRALAVLHDAHFCPYCDNPFVFLSFGHYANLGTSRWDAPCHPSVFP